MRSCRSVEWTRSMRCSRPWQRGITFLRGPKRRRRWAVYDRPRAKCACGRVLGACAVGKTGRDLCATGDAPQIGDAKPGRTTRCRSDGAVGMLLSRLPVVAPDEASGSATFIKRSIAAMERAHDWLSTFLRSERYSGRVAASGRAGARPRTDRSSFVGCAAGVACFARCGWTRRFCRRRRGGCHLGAGRARRARSACRMP